MQLTDAQLRTVAEDLATMSDPANRGDGFDGVYALELRLAEASDGYPAGTAVFTCGTYDAEDDCDRTTVSYIAPDGVESAPMEV
jgi:hypothetical protein